MKYIITESKLESAIIDILDEMFPVEDVNWYHPYDYDEDTGEEGDDENRLEFYMGDYEDDNACFRWYDCQYFNQGASAHDLCPMVSIEYPFDKKLNGYFGDNWHEPFKKWFTKNFDLPVKTVAVL